ncbi:hypothetical protein SEA_PHRAPPUCCINO_21 [Mycobacterium phage Phrappuccino]|uniref:Uncharacterized protein n=1 Tax=Mycobacterium phage Phrappuccino TaxID=2591223 RepID=A0A514DDK9_9CAUD|nr:hypothetical protein KHQ87_gp021 [Mycobacterium phage Phrappuccino]QDH91699.1 hypothetical protein SEA_PHRAPPUCCINO_21 [Mycobacterium phage Phrappuccino]QIQ63143.1 hypothetical protein SEA_SETTECANDELA_21 [Mycobacterium phage Settecandela]
MTRKLGKNQLIALRFASKAGRHAPTGAGNRPWQLQDSQYQRVLDSLVERGLVTRDDELGVITQTINFRNPERSKAKFTPFYEITDKGREALQEVAA